MAKLLPQQPAFKLFLAAPGNKRVEVTDYVKGNITMEIDENLISSVSFQLDNPDVHTEYLRRGYQIFLYAGEIDSTRFNNKDFLSAPNFTYYFGGSVQYIYSKYSEDGSFYVEVTGLDFSWSKSAYTNNYFAYPSVDCKRQWASRSTSLRLSEIVEGVVVTEMGLQLFIDISIDTTYKDISPAVQHNTTDWAFLRKLAQDNSCYVWTSHTEGNVSVYFVDKSKVVGTVGRYEFVWLGRAGKGFFQGDYLPEGDRVKESTKLKPHQIQIVGLDISESPQMEGMNISIITEFNEDTGETEEKLVSYDETQDEIIYYQLDQEKINSMEKTERGSKELNDIMALGPMNIPPGIFKKFYIPIKSEKGTTKAIDKPFLGITLSAKIRGNIDIKPFQSYPVHGVSRYGSKSKSGNYYLKAISYTWGSEGFLMDLTLVR